MSQLCIYLLFHIPELYQQYDKSMSEVLEISIQKPKDLEII